MRKLVLSGLVALGLAWAQAPYVGGHVGILGVQGSNINLNGGVHAGVGLQGGLEVRGGVDFTFTTGFKLLFTGVNADVLMNLSIPGSTALPYVGVGGNVWFSGGTTTFGAHATLGLKFPIPGAPLTAFLEAQPAYAFVQGGQFRYYLKLGANVRL